MEIFYSDDIQGSILTLPAEEAAHCLRVLRHRPGDSINVIDGLGTLYHCTLLDSATARIDSSEPGWHSHPYLLTLAVCPTKNPDRYEWMAEKATEVGLDTLVPVIGDRSERKVLGKAERLRKILLSAAKQSLKGAVPQLAAPLSVRDFVASFAPALSAPAAPSLCLIAYCSDEVQPRASIMALLREFWRSVAVEAIPTTPEATLALPEVIVLIGPEGDFSPEEVRAAMAAGFVPVSLGDSRLRTETAAVTAAEAVYLSLL